MQKSIATSIEPDLRYLIGVGYIVLSATLYGFLGLFGTLFCQHNNSTLNMLFWRFFIASLWILPFALKEHRLSFTSFHKWDYLNIGLLGIICYSGSSAFYFYASHSIGTGLAMTIFFAYPIIVMLLAWQIDGKPLSRVTLVTLSMLVVGLFLIHKPGAVAMSTAGIILALISASCYALYLFNSRNVSKRFSAMFITLIICLGNSGIFLVLALLDHSLAWPHHFLTIIYTLGLGIIATALPIQLMLQGLTAVDASSASIISVLEPVVTLILGQLLLHEQIARQQYYGIIIILSVAIINQWYVIKKTNIPVTN